MFRKSIAIMAALIIMAMAVTSCIIIDSEGIALTSVDGSGEIIAEERDVPAFNQINLRGAGKVTLTKGSYQHVQVETDDNIMPHIETKVNNGKLTISHEKKI